MSEQRECVNPHHSSVLKLRGAQSNDLTVWALPIVYANTVRQNVWEGKMKNGTFNYFAVLFEIIVYEGFQK